MAKDFPEELLKYLISEDELGLVIRAHLYVESWLEELLAALIPASSHIDEMNLTYANKVRLACAMGFDPDLKAMLLALGKIRNMFSHNLNKQIDSAMVKDLHSVMHTKTRDAFPKFLNSVRTDGEEIKSFSDAHPRDQFTALIITLLVVLDGAVEGAKALYSFENT